MGWTKLICNQIINSQLLLNMFKKKSHTQNNNTICILYKKKYMPVKSFPWQKVWHAGEGSSRQDNNSPHLTPQFWKQMVSNCNQVQLLCLFYFHLTEMKSLNGYFACAFNKKMYNDFSNKVYPLNAQVTKRHIKNTAEIYGISFAKITLKQKMWTK